MKEQSNSKTLQRGKTQNFGYILSFIHKEENTGIKAVYFRCVEWNKDARMKLWFRIIDHTKMLAYRQQDDQMIRMEGRVPDFRFNIADMFKEFEYIIER